LDISYGLGKFVQVKALKDIEDLSRFGIGYANNGGGSDSREFILPMMPLQKDEIVWIGQDENSLKTYFGESCFLGTEKEYYVQGNDKIDGNGKEKASFMFFVF